jgi:hypothetical protein
MTVRDRAAEGARIPSSEFRRPDGRAFTIQSRVELLNGFSR